MAKGRLFAHHLHFVHVHMENDVMEWFQNPVKVDLKTTHLLTDKYEVKMMADNYADMFTVDHVE